MLIPKEGMKVQQRTLKNGHLWKWRDDQRRVRRHERGRKKPKPKQNKKQDNKILREFREEIIGRGIVLLSYLEY